MPKKKKDMTSAAHYVKLIELKSLTMREVKNLVSDSREEKTFSVQAGEKYFNCHLYGAKYYCRQNGESKLGAVFDFCVKSKQERKITLGVSVDDTKIDDAPDLGGGIQSGKQHEKVIISNLRNTPHRDGFSSIVGVNNCNGFYVDGALKHVFSRIYDKNKRIKLVQDCGRLHWPKMAFSHPFSSKLYNSIPLFVALMEFLFENMKQNTSHYNYMSLMESINCLLLFKNYHKPENRKGGHNNDSSDIEFEQCNFLLSKKLMKLQNKKYDDPITWPKVCCCHALVFVFFFLSNRNNVWCISLHNFWHFGFFFVVLLVLWTRTDW